MFVETVRDYSKFNSVDFCSLIDAAEWGKFDESLDPSVQWRFIHDMITEILAIMCPIKKVHTRVHKKKWISKEIYNLIKEEKKSYQVISQ